MLELGARAFLRGADGLAILDDRDPVRVHLATKLVERADQLHREDLRDLARLIISELATALKRGSKKKG